MVTRLLTAGFFGLVLLGSISAQLPERPALLKTVASPLGLGAEGAIQVVAGWDFNADGKEDVVTLGFNSGGLAEVEVYQGNGAGAFDTGLTVGTANLGPVTLDSTEDSLAIGMFFETEALGVPAKPGIAVISGGALRLYNTTSGPAGSVSLVQKTAPTFPGATLRSVAAGDLNGDGLPDLVLTGRLDGGSNPGGVWVMLNGNSGFQTPTQLNSPGSEAGKVAIGDVNGDGFKDIVVVDTAEWCAKIYLAASAGVFSSNPLTLDAYGSTPSDVRPRAVAIGQILPGGAEEIVLWSDAEINNDDRQLQFAIFEHTGGTNFARHAVAHFGEHANNMIHYGDIALGDMNNDGQLDIVGTNPSETSVAIWPISRDTNGDVVTSYMPLLYYYNTSNTPSSVSIGNLNGDTGNNSAPKLDVVARVSVNSPNKTVDVFLSETEAPLPPGTLRITTTTWPEFGGDLTSVGAASSTLRYAAIVNGKPTNVLPNGQRISSVGEILGVSANGTYSVTIQVKSGTKVATKTFNFTVNNVAELTPGAVAWWPGEDAGADVVGNNFVKSLPPELPSYASGKVGRALSFDGVNDLVYAPDTYGHLDIRGNLTIEAWVKPALDSKGVRTIVAKHDSADLDLTYALQLEKNGDLSFVSRRKEDKKATIVTSLASVPNGVWTHVAVRVRGVEVTLFIDGWADMTKSVPATFFPPSTAHPASTTNQSVIIGASCTVESKLINYFKGEIDELTIYNRPLDNEEVDLVAKVGSAGKFRHDAAQEFSTAIPPQSASALWSYGSMPSHSILPGGFTPFPTLDTSNAALDVWKTSTAGAAEVRRNKLTTTHSTGTTTGLEYAPRQVAQQRGTDGSKSVVRWTAPAAGRYTVAATWKLIDRVPTSPAIALQHGSTLLVGGGVSPVEFLGNGYSYSQVIEVAAAGETVDFIVGQNFADTRDSVSLFASVVPLPEDYEAVPAPEPIQITYDQPVQTGKLWKFRVNQGGSSDHLGRIGIKLQYSVNGGAWTDVPNGNFVLTGSVGWQLLTRELPTGSNITFRVATTATGYETVYGDASSSFNIGVATKQLEFVSQEAEVASDPTGLTTHRGDLITYRFTVRNAGGLAPTGGAILRVIVPEGTTVKAKTKGGNFKTQRSLSGIPTQYVVWSLGNLASVPEDDAPVYEMTVQVNDPKLKDDLAINVVGSQIKQLNMMMHEGTFEKPVSGTYVFAPTQYTHTIVNPVTVTAAVISPTATKRGEFVRMEFTVRNTSSRQTKGGMIEITGNNGLVMQTGDNRLVFMDAGTESPIPPLDPFTKKRPKLTGYKTNPVLTELPDRRQQALFGITGMAPGAEVKVRASFRIPYDWPLNVPIELDTVKAYISTAAPTLATVTFPSVSVDVASDSVLEMPVLFAVTNQITAGTLENDRGIGQATVINAGVPNIKPTRTSNMITYSVHVGNRGRVGVGFLKAIVAVPEHTEYKKGSARVRTAKNYSGAELADPVFQSDQLFFDLPDLGNDSGNTNECILEFTVLVKKGTPLGTEIKFDGAFATSREVLRPAFDFQPRITRIVEPGRLRFTENRLPEVFTASTDFVYHTIFFANDGGLAKSGVGVRYTIPAGLKFHDAIITDRLSKTIAAGAFARRPITKPAANATSGDVVFDIGVLKPGQFGFAKIILAPDAANVPQTATGANPDGKFCATAGWVGYDSDTNPNAALREPRRFIEAASTVPAGGKIRQPYLSGTIAKPFVLLMGSSSAVIGDVMHYQVAWGNTSGVEITNSKMIFPIPANTEYVGAGHGTSIGSSTLNEVTYVAPASSPYPCGHVEWARNVGANDVTIASVSVRVLAGTTAATVETDSDVKMTGDQTLNLYAQTVVTHLLAAGTVVNDAVKAQIAASGMGPGSSAYIGAKGTVGAEAAAEVLKLDADSTSLALTGANFHRAAANGVTIIPIGGGRALAAGRASQISNSAAEDAIEIDNGRGYVMRTGTVGTLLVNMSAGPTSVSSIVANAATLRSSKQLGSFLNGGTTTLAPGTRLATIGAQGLISNVGGALVNAGGMNLIGNDGSTLIGNDGSTLVGNDGASLVGNDGASIVTDNGAGLIGNDGSTLIGNDGSTLIGNDGSTLISNTGGSLVKSGTGVSPTGN